jgi:magnesium chelatase family protein
MNPCPCGHLGSSLKVCRCTPEQVNRYQSRVSGPLLDRIDLQWVVHSLPPQELIGGSTEKIETSAQVRARVKRAQAVALERQGCLNEGLEATHAEKHCHLDDAGTDFVRRAAQRLGWSSRSTHRVLKVARTLADMADFQHVGVPHLAEAIQYRRALPAAGVGR